MQRFVENLQKLGKDMYEINNYIEITQDHLSFLPISAGFVKGI